MAPTTTPPSCAAAAPAWTTCSTAVARSRRWTSPTGTGPTARTPPRFPAPLPIATCCWASTRSSPSRSRPTPRLRARVWTIAPPLRTASRPRAAGSWTTSPPAPAPPTSRGSTATEKLVARYPGNTPGRRAPASAHVAHQPAGRRQLPPGSPHLHLGLQGAGRPLRGQPQRLVDLQRSRRRTTRPPAPSRPVPTTRTPWSTSPTTSTASDVWGRWRRHRQRRRHLDLRHLEAPGGPRPSATSRA